jgi:uncharacterized protein YjbI with pentapeptide repeats
MLKPHLQEAFDLHALWLKSDGEEGRQAILENLDLQLADLSGRDLRFAVLPGANLQRSTLDGANLDNADLRGVNLGYASLKWSTLRGANMTRARADGADFHGASLTGACVEQGNLDYADLRKTDLSAANFDQATFRQANLTHANLAGTSLRKVNLVGTKAAGVRFEQADTTDAQCDPGLISSTVQDQRELRNLHCWTRKIAFGALGIAALSLAAVAVAACADLLHWAGQGEGTGDTFSYLSWILAAVGSAVLGLVLLVLRLRVEQSADLLRMAAGVDGAALRSHAVPAQPGPAVMARGASQPVILTSGG